MLLNQKATCVGFCVKKKKKFGVILRLFFQFFERCLFLKCLFDEKYSNNSNIVKYYYLKWFNIIIIKKCLI